MSNSTPIAAELLTFAARARALLRQNVEQAVQNDTRPNRDVVHWYLGLGTLAWDVSGSVVRLLAADDVRAASMLNRSLFEYWVRIRYYTTFPDKASQAIRQLPTRIGKIDKAISDLHDLDSLTEAERVELEAFVAKGIKIDRESFRTDVLEMVMPKVDADRYYDFFYGKASAWIHGYETILPDVLSDHFHKVSSPQPHWRSQRLKANDTAGVAIHNILEVISEIRKARSLPAESGIEREWTAVQEMLERRDDRQHVT